jgi:L-lysine 2,3-aminomutase
VLAGFSPAICVSQLVVARYLNRALLLVTYLCA